MGEQGVRHVLDEIPIEVESRLQAGVRNANQHRVDIVVALDRAHVIAEWTTVGGHAGLEEERVIHDLWRFALEMGEGVVQIFLADAAPGANRVVNNVY